MFITFEGPDGSGKTTQARMLADRLRGAGCDVLTTREPGGTAVAEKIRQILLHEEDEEIGGETEALLYAAARSQLVRNVIRPALDRGQIVVCDRFIDSSLAYQGEARSLGWERVLRINEEALDGLWPDLTVLLELPPGESFARMDAAGRENDRMEESDLRFQESIREGYRRLARREPGRFVVLDGRCPPEETAGEVWTQVQARRGGSGGGGL